MLAAACSLVKPIETPADRQAQARTLAAGGKHADAARLYAALAAGDPATRDSYDLLAAEQWVAAGDLASAKQALAAVSDAARTQQPASRALVAAEIALAESDGSRALQELDAIAPPSEADLAQNYWYIRGMSAFLLGKPVEGTRAFVERERYLSDPAALKASREELAARLRTAAARGQSLKVPAKTDPVVAGWLQFAPVAAQLQREPVEGAGALRKWQRTYPEHPANAVAAEQSTAGADSANAGIGSNPGAAVPGVAPSVESGIAVVGAPAVQIALLLPLSGRTEAAGVAVRDGFIAAYFDQDEAARPRLRIYDVAAQPVGEAYQHAVQDGADFIIGPLTKEDVAAVAPLAAGRTPVLALNFLADGVTAPADLYQFALLPEDEARSVARRLVADGKTRGVTIVPFGEWGSRVSAAFEDELGHLGGSVVDTGHYQPAKQDFGDVIKQALQIHGAKGEEAMHRGDAQFIFVAGSPSAERLMISQLKFHFAGDIPVYATSDSFEPDAGANGDLDGLTFPDMPWMVSTDASTSRIRESVRGAWPARVARRDRLYAFGFDAYRLVPALRAGGFGELAGVTGKLRLDDHNRIRRELEWAQIKNGQPSVL